MKAEIGIIGGSGVYQLDGINVIEEIKVETPFGDPSAPFVIAEVEDKKVAFLPRHGKGHYYSPTLLPVKANIWAMKSLGVDKIISISAVGSLKEELKPGHFIIPNQIIDRTRHRNDTFFEEGIVGHIAFAEPFCTTLADYLFDTILASEVVPVHKNETYLCMEGPQFSTKAESNLYRSWGCGVIGMTAIPEAKLAREAEMCYATIAMSTDYDCWHEEEETVSLEMILKTMKNNVEAVKQVLPKIIKNIPDLSACGCKNAAQFAVMTSPEVMNADTKKKLELFYGKYWQ